MLVRTFAPVDLIVCSTAVRTRETLARSGVDAATVRYDERVYAASRDELLGVLDEIPDEVAKAVLIGHNPGLTELVRLLTGEESVELKTSAVAVLAWDGGWPDVWARNARLVALDTPRG